MYFRLCLLMTKLNNANEFLTYIAENQERLKRNLSKNVTYDKEIFEDVFQTTILKIYDHITANNIIVDDFERYFFTCSKWEYVSVDNKKRKHTAVHTDIEDYRESDGFLYELDDTEDAEEKNEAVRQRFKEFITYLSDTYGHFKTDVFIEYYTYKAERKKISYYKIGQEFGISEKEVGSIINEIRNDNIFINIK